MPATSGGGWTSQALEGRCEEGVKGDVILISQTGLPLLVAIGIWFGQVDTVFERRFRPPQDRYTRIRVRFLRGQVEIAMLLR